MGKKSKEPKEEEEISEGIKSLFSSSNPFRRKPQPSPPSDQPQGLGFPSPSADEKKRKLDNKAENPNPNPISSTPESVPKKRKKVEDVDEGQGGDLKKRKKKRKRDEIEEEYEKRKYGEAAEKEENVVKVGEKRKAKDVEASENLVANEEEEGFDDESKLLRTVFVGNLPLKIKKKVLMKEFEKFGEIESVRIRSVPLVDSKTPRKGSVITGKVNEAVGRVNAYIVFSNEQSAQAALSHNMSQIGENHIRVDMACPPRKKLKGETPLYDRKRTVFVGNLPFDLKDEELYQLFCGLNELGSNVEAVRVVRDPQTSLGRGIAYVLFKTRDAANTVSRMRDLKIRDRLLRVCHVKSDAASSKRKESASKKDFTPLKRKEHAFKKDFPRKKFAQTSNEKSFGKSDKPKAATSLSYQGVRSSKSGVVKKSGLHSHSRSHSRSSGQENHGINRAGGSDKKVNKAKRPAVAARKAKLTKKRKLESGTPENTHRSKKMRKQ